MTSVESSKYVLGIMESISSFLENAASFSKYIYRYYTLYKSFHSEIIRKTLILT